MSDDEREIPTTKNCENLSSEEKEKEISKKRQELIQLSEDGEISQSVASLKKASGKVVLKIYAEYERQQAEKANAFLTDLLLSKFANLLGGLEAIESSEALEKELLKDKLLRRDVKFLLEKVTPFLPYLGILSGGITVGKHIGKRNIQTMRNKKNEIFSSSIFFPVMQSIMGECDLSISLKLAMSPVNQNQTVMASGFLCLPECNAACQPRSRG